jgi:predicted amidohydrolase YtcJ
VRTLLVPEGVWTGTGGAACERLAVLVEGPTVAWVGPPSEAPAADAIRRLDGAWLLPAFVDAHVHATATGLAVDGVDLGDVTALPEALARVREGAQRRASGDPVLGVRWEEAEWPEGRPPSAAELTEAGGGRPVLLTRVDAHSCVVDEGTLAGLPLERLAGVDRDADGAPTGWLREAASEAAQTEVRARLSPARLQAARLAACARAAALGIASLHEMGHPGISGIADSRAWVGGSWPVEVLVWWAELDVARARAEGLRPGGDLFLDGSIGSHTAAVADGYLDAPGHGQLFHGDEEVTGFFDAATAAGLGAGVHAIGDRAIAQAAAALATVAGRRGEDAVRRCRHRVEHVELPRPEDVELLSRLGVVASVQPAFDEAWGGDDRLYARRFGVERARGSNPLGLLAAAGVPLAFGSDSTVTPLDPWGAVVAAERHRGGHALDRPAALAAHTVGGRYVAGQDGVGRITVGQRADLALYDGDPLGVEDPRTLACVGTVVTGADAHGTTLDVAGVTSR